MDSSLFLNTMLTDWLNCHRASFVRTKIASRYDRVVRRQNRIRGLRNAAHLHSRDKPKTSRPFPDSRSIASGQSVTRKKERPLLLSVNQTLKASYRRSMVRNGRMANDNQSIVFPPIMRGRRRWRTNIIQCCGVDARVVRSSVSRRVFLWSAIIAARSSNPMFTFWVHLYERLEQTNDNWQFARHTITWAILAPHLPAAAAALAP